MNKRIDPKHGITGRILDGASGCPGIMEWIDPNFPQDVQEKQRRANDHRVTGGKQVSKPETVSEN